MYVLPTQPEPSRDTMQDLRAAILANATVLKRERMVKQAQYDQQSSKRNSVQSLGARKGSIITKALSNGNGKEQKTPNGDSNGRKESDGSVEPPKRFWMEVITRAGDTDAAQTIAVIIYRHEEFGESFKLLESLEMVTEQGALLCLLQITKNELKAHFERVPLLMANKPKSADGSEESLQSS